MPKVPERKLSYGELQEKNRKATRFTKSPGTRHFPEYAFKEAPKGSKNGALKITRPSELPHPLKCSKCSYIATSVQDSKQHWLDHD